MTLLTRIALCVVALSLVLFLIGRCTPLPSLDGRSTSTALFDTNDTRLGRSITPLAEAHPGLSGIYPLANSQDAFAARMQLAQAADRTLDLQYYIWEKDMTGTLLFDALRAAAERGVRVRLLLDDNNTSGLDRTLAALDSHPNIEVRFFNPFVIRKPRIGYLTEFFRSNRRMHNKSFTADNQATIIGGRNVGDEYFGAAEAVERDPAAVAYTTALHDSPFVRDLVARRLGLEWASAHMISDDPAKGLGLAAPENLFPQQLNEVIGEPATDVELVAAYYIPTATGVNSFVSLARRGVKIKVLTNSLQASDGPYVYSGYAKHRKSLLKAGITLYEMRPLSPHTGEHKSAGLLGSSGSSLHAKTFSVDRARFFVGSFNFDPRSRKLNTELGFVIDSPVLAQTIERAFNDSIPANSYEVRLSEAARLYWIERRGAEETRYDQSPNTSIWQRAAVWFLSLLPIEWLL